MRKPSNAERGAWDAEPEKDTRRCTRRRGAGRVVSFDLTAGRKADSPTAESDYRNSLDVATFAGHSTRAPQPRSRWLMLSDIALASGVHRRPRNGAKNGRAEFDKLLRSFNRLRIQFLHADLDVGLTMARIAASADFHSDRRERNARNARQAYEAVLRLRHKVATTTAERHQLSRKLGELHAVLTNLGEAVPAAAMAA